MPFGRIVKLTSPAVLAAMALFVQTILISQVRAEGLSQALPPQPLADALEAFARSVGLQLVYGPEITAGLKSPGAQPGHSIEDTLRELLRGTGLTFEFVNEKTVTLLPQAQAKEAASVSDSGGQSAESRNTALAQLDLPSPSQGKDRGEVSRSKVTDERSQRVQSPQVTELEEIVVTGSQIRGVKDIASPISVHTREEIDRTGAGSVQRFIQTLPENFQGGAWEGTLGSLAGGGTAANNVNGTGINLRGLGNDSTLILLNGRRIAPGNSLGNWVDVSMLPLAAIDRIEVVSDGASALYGSDAVGGVVNFIMREKYEGAETRLRYASVTEGKMRDYQLAQTAGLAWNTGSALLSYEFLKQTPLELFDKSWVRTPPVEGAFDVLPEQKRHGVFTSLKQSVGDRVVLFVDGTYSARSMPKNRFSSIYGNENAPAEVESYSATMGARSLIADKHEFELAASWAASDSETKYFFGTDDLPLTHRDADARISGIESKLTGSLFPTRAGAISYAAGLAYRKEEFKNSNLLTDTTVFNTDRGIWAGFAELRVPLIAGEARNQPKLELSLAGRYENYSDFGSTTNPKVGLIFNPLADLRLRATWGTSFRAPALNDLNPVHSQVAADAAVFDPVLGETVPVVFIYGGNPNLAPEKATSWTLGADWNPKGISGLSGRLTYYDISYTDRITNPQLAFAGVGDTFQPLQIEDLLAQFIVRNPTVAQLEAHIANSLRQSLDDFTGIPGGVDLATVAALVDYSTVNLSSVKTSGIDFELSFDWHAWGASVTTGIDGTYVFKLDNELAPGTPVINAIDTVFNPADLKARAKAIFQRGSLTIALFANYIDSYKDTRAGTNASVSSWTTLDANVSYRFDDHPKPWNDLSISIGATNLADKAPPFVAPTYSDLGMVVFDGANHDVRGRVIYAQLIKQF